MRGAACMVIQGGAGPGQAWLDGGECMRGRFEEKRNPTPEEIREACAEIRAGWTKQERRQRLVVRESRWAVPVCVSAGVEEEPGEGF